MGNMNADRRSVPTRAQRRRLALATRPAVESFILIVATALVALEGRASLAGTFGHHVGAAYQPYVGQSPDGGKTYPAWNSYDSGNWSVQKQVSQWVAPRFSLLATYGAGTRPDTTPGTPLNKLDSNSLVAGAAANYNNQAKFLAVIVSQGISQQVQSGSLDTVHTITEINDAFKIAEAANNTFPGTVKRLIFTNEYVTNATTTNQVDQLINMKPDLQGQPPPPSYKPSYKSYKEWANGMGLTVGVRSNTFGQLNDLNSPYLKELRTLVKDVDFIMLNLYPDETKDPIQGANQVTIAYNMIMKAAKAQNSNIEVLIGETGWSSDDTPAGRQNERNYFDTIRAWANKYLVETYVFEAIDEPWKHNQNQDHYGLMYYNASDNTGGYVLKWDLRP